MVYYLVYASDPSVFKLGTRIPVNSTSTRICGWAPLPKPCPFSNPGIATVNKTGDLTFDYPHGYNATVPQSVIDIFSSGVVDSETVSSFFDIRWRTTVAMQDIHINNNTDFRVGAYRNLQSLALGNRIDVVEGLIVDTVSGGVGFRNHTVPIGLPHGVTWQEDILFMTPETTCVDTNLTLDYTVLNGNQSMSTIVVLTDRGGFVNATPNQTVVDYQNSQKDPDLYTRAYIAAHLHNYLTGLYFNVTNMANGTVHGWSLYNKSAMNKTFRVDGGTPYYDDVNTRGLTISQDFSHYLQEMNGMTDAARPGISTNVYGVTRTNYSYIRK